MTKKAQDTALDRLQATLALDEPVSRVRLVSPQRAKLLGKLGIASVRDLVTHFPRSYIDLSRVETAASASIGEMCTVCGTVHSIKQKQNRRRLSIVEMGVVDDTGIVVVTFFNQRWLLDQIHSGDRVAVSGKVEFNYGFKRMTNPFVEVIEEGASPVGRIIPVHGATEKLSAAWIRRLMANALELIEGLFDPLPLDIRMRYRLMSRNCALQSVQFPATMDEVHEARRRLIYEEVFYLELFLMLENSRRAEGKTAVSHKVNGPHVQAFEKGLPFELTQEQETARDEILAVMHAPMIGNHLLLGDVGTGKTVVAGFALCAAADSSGQALLMAPTEVLARQHAASLGDLLDKAQVSYGLLTGSTPAAERKAMTDAFAAGNLDVLIGTHALLSDDVAPRNLTLVIIDEQQRFGVDQRAKLLSKGAAPDALYLTATPIPRSLALTLFGNLSLSYIKHRPHASAERTTKVVEKTNIGVAYDAAREALGRGEQVFVVCPLIGQSSEERDKRAVEGTSSASGGTLAALQQQESAEELYHPKVAIEGEADFAGDNVTAAVKEVEILRSSVFADHEVGLLHGKLSAEEKRQVMESFRKGDTDVLVATTVIEVGVDVPNATVMIVQDADRFGLAQLHQLRGRVGRGEKPAQVFLVSASQREESLARLAAMESTDDGFELASFDLSLRREGDILGNRQHGASGLKLVNVMRDGAIIEAARADAQAMIELDPLLQDPDHAALAREVRLTFGTAEVSGG